MNIGGNQARVPTLDSEAAAEIAYRALGFLASEPERIERFLSLTGLATGDLREIAPEVSFQLAVLDHLAGDEALLTDFVQDAGLSPEVISAARRALGGGEAG